MRKLSTSNFRRPHFFLVTKELNPYQNGQDIFAQSRKGAKEISPVLDLTQDSKAADVLCAFAALRETPWFLT
jgi:hypothetical protein